MHGQGLGLVIHTDKAGLVRARSERYFTYLGLEVKLKFKSVITEWGCRRYNEKTVPTGRRKEEVGRSGKERSGRGGGVGGSLLLVRGGEGSKGGNK